MPVLDGLRKLALSDGMRRLAHYTDYFTPVLFMVMGVGLLIAMFLSPPTDELGLEATLLLGAAGLFVLGFGAWSFWRHSRRDPTAPRKTWTVDDLPLEERAAAVRRLMLLLSAAIIVGSGFILYQLVQLEFGWAQRVSTIHVGFTLKSESGGRKHLSSQLCNTSTIASASTCAPSAMSSSLVFSVQ